ncbi:MAG: helix-turn-helix domain-containing protein [Planctomycetota bacterium]
MNARSTREAASKADPKPNEAGELECVADPARAAALLHPLRASVLAEARTPISAAGIATRLGVPRQRVNYHVRELHRCGFLHKAGTRKKRGMTEQRYIATARAYLLAPAVLGGAALDRATVAGPFSSAYLLALAAQLQNEVSVAREQAAAAAKPLPTMSVSSEFRFESAQQRTAFTEALQQAVVDVVARFTSPQQGRSGGEAPGRPYRLLVGSWPIPPTDSAQKMTAKKKTPLKDTAQESDEEQPNA